MTVSSVLGVMWLCAIVMWLCVSVCHCHVTLCQCVSVMWLLVLCDYVPISCQCRDCASLLLVSCDCRDDTCSINTYNSWDCPLEFDAYHFGDNSLIHHFQHTWDRAMAVYPHHCWNLTLAVHWSSSHVFWRTSSCTVLLGYTSLLVSFLDTDPFSSSGTPPFCSSSSSLTPPFSGTPLFLQLSFQALIFSLAHTQVSNMHLNPVLVCQTQISSLADTYFLTYLVLQCTWSWAVIWF